MLYASFKVKLCRTILSWLHTRVLRRPHYVHGSHWYLDNSYVRFSSRWINHTRFKWVLILGLYFFSAMSSRSSSIKEELGPKTRNRSSSANEASKPISVLTRRQTHAGSKSHGLSPSSGKLIYLHAFNDSQYTIISCKISFTFLNNCHF